MIKLSKAGKMPCRSWSLQAIDTCPASLGDDGELVDACKGCYATTGNYNFPNVKAPRLHNKEDWQRAEWVADMIAELDNDRYFRWFDSGDVYHIKLAEKILEVCKATPWTRHWLPTRMHKFKKFRKVIDELNKLDNVVVRLSSDSVNGEIIEGVNTSTIIPYDDTPTVAEICKAYLNDGKCGTCRKCWTKDVPVVAYVAHGVRMKKVLRENNLISTLQVA
jgi:hypothetical protein